MKAKLINERDGQKTMALIFDKGDEFMSELKEFAIEQELDGSHFMAIGAFSQVTLGYIDLGASVK